jgi:SAM-dependent methyltransferase
MGAKTKEQVAYYPQFFDAPDLEAAKAIILTPEEGLTTEQRWESETEYLVELVDRHFTRSTGVVVDYGCGVGRLAKVMIDRWDCAVVGVDISTKMRALATEYVDRRKFVACDPSALPLFGRAFADLVLSVWVLQHCNRPLHDMRAMREAMRDGATLFVVNETDRLIPSCTEEGQCWTTDGLKIKGLLEMQFQPRVVSVLDPAVVSQAVSRRTFWGAYGQLAASPSAWRT